MSEGDQQDDLAWYACTAADQLNETGAGRESELLRNCTIKQLRPHRRLSNFEVEFALYYSVKMAL